MPAKPKKLNLKNETVILTKCNIFNKANQRIGKGYTLQRQNGYLVGSFGIEGFDKDIDEEINNENLSEGYYQIRHTDEQYLAVVCWVVQ